MPGPTYEHHASIFQSYVYLSIWTVHRNQFFKDFIYLFLKRRKERGRGGKKHQCVVGLLSSVVYCGPGRQPRHVSWLRIELVTLSFAGHSIHWATPARARNQFLCRPSHLQMAWFVLIFSNNIKVYHQYIICDPNVHVRSILCLFKK